jgi:hypothetical protein
VLPANSDNGPAITVVTPFAEIMRQQEAVKKQETPPVYLYHGKYPSPLDGTHLIYPPGFPEAHYHAPCDQYPAWSMGVPAWVLQRHARLPESVRAVYDNPERLVLLCRYCIEFINLEFDSDDNELVGAFCGSCLIALNSAPGYACACGNPRHLNALAQPSGAVCSTCHQQGPGRKNPRRRRRRR